MIAKDSLNMSKQNCQNNSGYMNCAIYTRVSTDNQAEVEFNSCQAQEEYQQKKAKLLNEKKDLQERLGEIEKTGGGWLEPAKELVTTCNQAGSVAWQGNPSAKRDFLKILGSNLILKDRNLIMKRAYPYELVAKISPSSNWLPREDSDLGPGGYT